MCSACTHCTSLKSIPSHLYPQSSTPPPDKIGVSFSLDVMRRYRQYAVILRETISSFTLTDLIENEQHITLLNAIIALYAGVCTLGDGGATIRVDPAPGLRALVNDRVCKEHGIVIELGAEKNINKNPVAEHAIKELGIECLHVCPDEGPLSKVTLALATANMNSRIRQDGLSAKEIWTQRDQITGEQLPIEDRLIILKQHFNRVHNHGFSAKSKVNGRHACEPPCVNVGDLVFLVMDSDKAKARDKYLVIAVFDDHCQVHNVQSRLNV